MDKGRLEAFSDGVIAIIITIMVLEMKLPQGGVALSALRPLAPQFLSYALSFVFIAIYWNNHHHLLQAAQCVNAKILWANMHLLFWLSLVPFATGWMGENNFPPLPVALYGVVLLCCGMAYFILTKTLIDQHGKDSVLARAVGRDIKGKLSLLAYVAAIALSFVASWVAYLIYIAVAILWLVPHRNIEKSLNTEEC